MKYALSIGLCFLMFGAVMPSSSVFSQDRDQSEEQSKKEESYREKMLKRNQLRETSSSSTQDIVNKYFGADKSGTTSSGSKYSNSIREVVERNYGTEEKETTASYIRGYLRRQNVFLKTNDLDSRDKISAFFDSCPRCKDILVPVGGTGCPVVKPKTSCERNPELCD